MTTPRVIELPRRLEPISRDTFLGAGEGEPPTAREHDAPLAVVVAIRPQDARVMRPVPRRRRGARALRIVADVGSGDQPA